MELYGALEGRRSDRDFAAGGEIAEEVLSRLLWAASGINRRDGRLTVPTALDSRDLRVFVLDGRGVWLYLPEAHALVCRRGGDWRKVSGKQRFAGNAAVNLVYAVDLSVLEGRGLPTEAIVRNGMFEAGCAAQNVALACVSEGLKNVVRGSWPAEELAAALDLPEGWRILIAQSVGP
jgi:nitroreductase